MKATPAKAHFFDTLALTNPLNQVLTMNNVEPFRIETTRERLVAAVALAKASFVQHADVEGLEAEEARAILEAKQAHEIGVVTLRAEMDAIFYTLRLRGVAVEDFSKHVGDLTADDILIAVELSPENEDEVLVYTLGDAKEVTKDV